jgi:hypothetical protein
MKEIYIIGASGLAKEVANYILDLPQSYCILGFIEKETCENKDIHIRGQKYPVIDERTCIINQIIYRTSDNVSHIR